MQNGRPEPLDLTAYAVERTPIKIGDYEGTIANDLPLPLIVKLRGSWNVLQDIDNATEDQAIALEASLWRLAEEVFAHAQPKLERPIREQLTLMGVMTLLGFLANSLGERQSSTKSLQLQSSTKGRSRSKTSSAVAPSSSPPSV